MSDTDGTGFGKFVPGFDFLQGLAKGAAQSIPQMPNLASWVSPSLNVEDLEKRIGELRAVHFWLEQNSRALGATIQALEVQKMTLATLKGMNFNLGDVANAFTPKAADPRSGSVDKDSERAGAGAQTETRTKTEKEADSEGEATLSNSSAPRKAGGGKSKAAPAGSLVDPLNLWGALTQQFQQIAAGAMQDASRKTAFDAGSMATGLTKETAKAGKKVSAARARKPAAKAKSASRSRQGAG